MQVRTSAGPPLERRKAAPDPKVRRGSQWWPSPCTAKYKCPRGRSTPPAEAKTGRSCAAHGHGAHFARGVHFDWSRGLPAHSTGYVRGGVDAGAPPLGHFGPSRHVGQPVRDVHRWINQAEAHSRETRCGRRAPAPAHPEAAPYRAHEAAPYRAHEAVIVHWRPPSSLAVVAARRLATAASTSSSDPLSARRLTGRPSSGALWPHDPARARASELRAQRDPTLRRRRPSAPPQAAAPSQIPRGRIRRRAC
jgi:hypothetical protein